ncbi:hypothetical protein TNCV_3264891 [Trichonephila clavipes]|nr:hypothetical protein TNCV_3264891 [Trichonephila clavipes]
MGAMGRNGPIACFKCLIDAPSASLPYIDQREHSVVMYFIQGVCYNTWTFTPPVPSEEHHCETHKNHVARQKNGRSITGKENSSGPVIVLQFFLLPPLANVGRDGKNNFGKYFYTTKKQEGFSYYKLTTRSTINRKQ